MSNARVMGASGRGEGTAVAATRVKLNHATCHLRGLANRDLRARDSHRMQEVHCHRASDL